MDIYSEKKAMKDLNSLYAEAVYGKPKSAGQELASREKRDDAAGAPKKMIVTRADKKANTKAYQNYKAGVKGYAAADHLKNEEYGELYSTVYSEDEKYGYDKDGNSLNPVDIEKKKKKDNNLAGAPNVKKEGYQRDPEQQEKERKTSKQSDPSKDNFTGISGSIATIMKQNAAMKKAAANKTKKEEFSSWRDDLSEVLTATEKQVDKEVKETKVKNKVIIDPEVKLEQALGGKVESIQEEECDECGSEEHTTEEHEMSVKEEILLDRAVVALSEMNIDEDIADIIARLEKKRISKGGNPDDSPLPAMKKYHADKKKKAAKDEK